MAAVVQLQSSQLIKMLRSEALWYNDRHDMRRHDLQNCKDKCVIF